MLALINKDTLKAICDNIGVHPSYIANVVKCNPVSKVDDWMNISSSSLPTFNQAKKVAKCLKVPFAGLYMNPNDVKARKIPKITNRRSFPTGTFEDDSSLNIAIADLLVSRDLLLSVKTEMKEQQTKFSISVQDSDNVMIWANEIRRLFELKLDEQFKMTSARKFYLYIRQKIENKGIFVHCFTDVDLSIVRGLAIYDDIMPVIGLNDNDRYPAKTFSIIHELTHILKRQSSLCNEFFNMFSQQQEEIFCNAVAGEVLAPKDSLLIKLHNIRKKDGITVADIGKLAQHFNISKEVITRRLLDLGQISQTAYDTYMDEFRRAIELEKEEQKVARKEGRAPKIPRNPSREAIDRTSSSLCVSLYKGYSDAIFSKQDICRYIGLSQKYADKFLLEVSTWNS